MESSLPYLLMSIYEARVRFGTQNFGLSGDFHGRFRPVSADSGLFRPYRSPADIGQYGRYGPSRPDFGRVGPISAASACVGPSRDPPRGATRHDAGRTRGLRRPSRVAASRRVGRGCAGLGAAITYCLRESYEEDVVDASRTLRRCEVSDDLDKGM
uniref:Uncharacterized protein n=1 Tax=Quercus lobata TaxID=97700 RepID=A0A7N2L5R8_QUELO